MKGQSRIWSPALAYFASSRDFNKPINFLTQRITLWHLGSLSNFFGFFFQLRKKLRQRQKWHISFSFFFFFYTSMSCGDVNKLNSWRVWATGWLMVTSGRALSLSPLWWQITESLEDTDITTISWKMETDTPWIFCIYKKPKYSNEYTL